METQKPKIVFYQSRSMGDKLNAALDFIKENWRILFKFSLYIILPMSVIQGVFPDISMQTTLFKLRDGLDEITFPDVALVVLDVIGSIYLMSLVYTLMRIYNEREERLEGVTFTSILPSVNRGTGRLILFFLSFLCAIFVLGFLGAFILPLLIMLLITLVILLMPLMLAPAIYMFQEDANLPKVWDQTFRLGFPTWGGTFGLVLICGTLSTIFVLAVSLPWLILSGVGELFSTSYIEPDSPLYKFLQYIFSTISVFVAYLFNVFAYVVYAYQYAHAREVIDHVGIGSEIDRFDNLGPADE